MPAHWGWVDRAFDWCVSAFMQQEIDEWDQLWSIKGVGMNHLSGFRRHVGQKRSELTTSGRHPREKHTVEQHVPVWGPSQCYAGTTS